MNRRLVSLMVIAAFLITAGYFTVSASSSPQQSPPASQKGKTAAEAFKNIQVLKDMPASKLGQTMDFIAASLGVRCDFCHVRPFDKDEKPEKQTARKMMMMVQAINKDNFHGNTVVSCATCHQGHAEPISFPPVAGLVEPEPDKDQSSLPTLDEILQKYQTAIGGSDAIAKISSRETKYTTEGGRFGKLEVDSFQKAPGKLYQQITMQQGMMTRVYDGSSAWMQMSGPQGRTRQIEGSELESMRADAQLFRGLALKDSESNASVLGRGKLGGVQVYAVGTRSADGDRSFYFFDASTGLLIDIYTMEQNPLGSTMTTQEFSDYRDVDGVKIPFTIKEGSPGAVQTIHYSEVKQNVTVDDSKFSKPAGGEAGKG